MMELSGNAVKIQDLKQDARYEIIRSDETRILFKRRSYEPGHP